MAENRNQFLPNPFEGWVTIDEAAKIVSRPDTTVRTWANEGKITNYHLGT